MWIKWNQMKQNSSTDFITSVQLQRRNMPALEFRFVWKYLSVHSWYIGFCGVYFLVRHSFNEIRAHFEFHKLDVAVYISVKRDDNSMILSMFSIIMVADGWRPKWYPKNVWRFHLNGMFIGAEHRILVLIFIPGMRDLRQENKNYFRPRTTNTPSSRNIKNIRCNFGLHGDPYDECVEHIHLFTWMILNSFASRHCYAAGMDIWIWISICA